MTTDIEDRLGAALRARTAQLTLDPAHLDAGSVMGRRHGMPNRTAWLAVAASALAVLIVAAGLLVFTRSDSTAPAGPGSTRPPAGPTTGRTAETGTIIGTLRLVGGPAPGVDRSVPGDITVTSTGADDTVSAQSMTDANGHFFVGVPPGRYLLTGTSPQYYTGACQGGTVTVRAGARLTRDVLCEMR